MWKWLAAKHHLTGYWHRIKYQFGKRTIYGQKYFLILVWVQNVQYCYLIFFDSCNIGNFQKLPDFLHTGAKNKRKKKKKKSHPESENLPLAYPIYQHYQSSAVQL